MFNQPIKHVRITSMEELLKFSYWTERKAAPLSLWQHSGQIAFAVENGSVYVTPYRPEVNKLLEENGYRRNSFLVPFSDGEERPHFYKWLVKIAEQECWAYTHEQARIISQSKGIKPVDPNTGNLRIREITRSQQEGKWGFNPMVSLYLHNLTEENVATYIVVDDRTVLLCDEYGRTFFVQAKVVINDFVNTLIDAGYTRTVHPESYVREVEVPDTSD